MTAPTMIAEPGSPGDGPAEHAVDESLVLGAQTLADERLRGDRERIERERGRREDRERDLPARELLGAERGRDGDRGEQRDAQRDRAQEQPASRARRAAHTLALRADGCLMPAREPPDDDDVRGHHSPLRHDRAGGGPGDAPAEAVDEGPVEQRVDAEADACDPQRRHGVLHAAKEPGGGEDDEHRRQAPHRDAEVDLGLRRDLGRGTEQSDEERRGEESDEREDRAEPERQPHAVDPRRHGLGRVARAEPARDRGRRRVGEEDHQPDDRLEHGRGDPEAGERLDAEVADERGVDDEEQRLGDERAQRRHGEPQDVAVQRVGGHCTSLRASAAGSAITAPARCVERPHILERMTETPRSGLRLDELSSEIRPQDDLFRHVNGAWLERTEIPEDKARWGSFHLIAEQAEKDVRAIVEESQDAEPGTESRKIGDLYTSFMDTERIDALGARR